MFGKKNNNYKSSERRERSSSRGSSRDDSYMRYDRKKDESDGLSTYRAMLRDGLIDPNA